MNDAELEQATRELNAAVNEVVRYMNNRNDYFIVSVGSFEVRFDLAKLGKPREEGGANVEQCMAAKVPVFVKQLDINGRCVTDINRFPAHLRIRQVPWAKENQP